MSCLASQRLTTDLETAPMTGITLPTSGPKGMLAIHGLASVTDTGAPVYCQQIVLYCWDQPSGSLTRKLWPPGPPATPAVSLDMPMQLTQATMASIWGTANGTEHLLVGGPMFNFSLTAGSTNTLPLHIHFTLQESVAGRAAQTYVLDKDVYPRVGS